MRSHSSLIRQWICHDLFSETHAHAFVLHLCLLEMANKERSRCVTWSRVAMVGLLTRCPVVSTVL